MNIDQIHKELLVWDAHRDLHYELPLEERFLKRNLHDVDLHLNLLQKGGINVQTYAFCYGSQSDSPPTIQAVSDLEQVLQKLEGHKSEISHVCSIQEMEQARKAGKIAAFFSFEGGEPIMEDIWILRFFYRMGFRAMGLTWNHRNALADGGYEGRDGYGLSNFGKQVVKEMNHLGMVVDLAHLTPQSMRDVLAISEQPVIHSHGGVRGMNPNHPRTLDDELLESIVKNDGVFCVTTVPAALVTGRDANIDDFLNQIDYAIRMMGEDHVGLGADFDVYQSHLQNPIGTWTKDLEEVDKWMNVTEGLLGRGHSISTIAKVMGNNLKRVYQTVIGE